MQNKKINWYGNITRKDKKICPQPDSTMEGKDTRTLREGVQSNGSMKSEKDKLKKEKEQ